MFDNLSKISILIWIDCIAILPNSTITNLFNFFTIRCFHRSSFSSCFFIHCRSNFNYRCCFLRCNSACGHSCTCCLLFNHHDSFRCISYFCSMNFSNCAFALVCRVCFIHSNWGKCHNHYEWERWNHHDSKDNILTYLSSIVQILFVLPLMEVD